MSLLRALHDDEMTTIVMITHDPAQAARAGRIVKLVEGRQVEGSPSP